MFWAKPLCVEVLSLEFANWFWWGVCKTGFGGEMTDHFRQDVCGMVLPDSCAPMVCRGVASDKN